MAFVAIYQIFNIDFQTDQEKKFGGGGVLGGWGLNNINVLLIWFLLVGSVGKNNIYKKLFETY